jgi:predicted dehydrogenase
VLRCNLVPEHVAVEEEAKVEFRAGSDAYGVLRFSDRSTLPNLMRLEGEEGFLEFDTFDYPSLKVFLRGSQLCRTFGAIAFKWPQTSPYAKQLEHFVDYLIGKEPRLLNCGEDSVENIGFVTKAYSSARRALR